MAVNTGQSSKPYSLPWIANQSFDPEFQVSVVELLSYDPLGRDASGAVVGAMKRVTTTALGEYGVNDIDESVPLTYIGKEDSAADWVIQRIDTSSGQSFRYATMKNNPTTPDYTTAWTNRASLTFGTYSQAY